MFPLTAFLIALAVLYLPGCIIWNNRFNNPAATAAAAPPTSIFAYVLVGILCSKLHIAISAISVFTFTVLLSIGISLFFLIISKTRKTNPSIAKPNGQDFLPLLICIGTGFVFAYWFFSHSLVDWSHLTQSEDNIRHYAYIRSLLNSTDWSTLNVSMYGIGVSQSLNPYLSQTGGFYPLGWHIPSAITCALAATSIGIGTNVVNFTLIGISLPLGSYYLISQVFPNESKLRVATGAIVSLVLPASPWVLLAVWPLFPNLATMCLVPAAAALFIDATTDSSAYRSTKIAAFILCCGGVSVTQPNGIFVCAVFLIPYTVWICSRHAGEKQFANKLGKEKVKLIAGSAAGLSISLIWLFVYKLPSFQGVVSYYWSPISTIWQAMVDCLVTAYPIQPASIFVALLCTAGALQLLRKKLYWPVISYSLAIILYVVAAAFGDNVIKHVLTGFWYTDPYRVAAMLAFCCIPVAYSGFTLLLETVKAIADRLDMPSRSYIVPIAAILALFIVFALPSFAIRGIAEITTPYSTMTANMRGFTRVDEGAILTESKIEFLNKVATITGPNAVIANTPYDGSCFAKGIANLNLLFCNDENYTELTTSSWAIDLRSNLCNYTNSNSTREIVREKDVRYVLCLQADEKIMKAWYPSFEQPNWTGILSITETTPGFELVLQTGDMVLYKITD